MTEMLEWLGATDRTIWDWGSLVLSIMGAIGGGVWLLDRISKFWARRRAGKDLKSLVSMVEFYEKSATVLADFENNHWGATSMLIRDLGMMVFIVSVVLLIVQVAPIEFDILLVVAGIWLAAVEFDKLNRNARAIHGGQTRLDEQAARIDEALSNLISHSSDLPPNARERLGSLADKWKTITAPPAAQPELALAEPQAMELEPVSDAELEQRLKSLLKTVATVVSARL